MTGRRPQDPRTRPIRADDEAHIQTLGPDPGATVAPDEQRDIETSDPSATVLPGGFVAPKPRSSLIESNAARAMSELEGKRKAQAPAPATGVRSSGIVRGGAATRVPGLDDPGDKPLTSEAVDDLRAGLRAKAAGAKPDLASAGSAPEGKRKDQTTTTVPRVTAKKKSSWLVWTLAFVVLGGIGFAVAWFVMNPAGGAAVAAEEVAAAPAEEVQEAAADAGEQAADVAQAAAADVSEEVAAEAQVAAAEVAAETVPVAEDVAVAAAEPVVEVVDQAAEVAADATVVAAVDVAAVPDSAAEPVADVVVEKPEVVVIVRNPVEATRLNEDGLAARKRGDHAAAMQLYKEALAQDQNHVWARYNYACELALAGRDKDAIGELTFLYKLGTADAKRALSAARKDSDFASIKNLGQFFRLTNF